MDEKNHQREDDPSESSDYTSENQGAEDCRRGGYHAVRISDTVKGRQYVVHSKLGWAHFSTVWLASDTIASLRFWPLNKVLMEKCKFSEQDANAMVDFLVPILDFVPEKRPTAAQCLLHPWINAGPCLLGPPVPCIQSQAADSLNSEKTKREKEEREAMEVGMVNIAINSNSKPVKRSRGQK